MPPDSDHSDMETGARRYLPGFGNEHASEAQTSALPEQNSPQRAPFGLYVEQMSGTSFTAPRADNRRSWLYRIVPSARHSPFRSISNKSLRTAPISDGEVTPNRLRWDPLRLPTQPTDFLDGCLTLVCNGHAALQEGTAIHVYVANRSMARRYFYNADGELLIVPQLGRLGLATEFGLLDIAPGEIAVVPRGIRFRVDLADDVARGYVCESYGASFRLPELGPLGANALAYARDFLYPVAAFEESSDSCELIAKFQGALWSVELDHSPLDVVAWRGNYAPYKYNLARFNAIGSVSFDHPDPSIFTVLTSQSSRENTSNVDFAIFPPRWLVADHTFRPPWYHRNVMSEFMGLVSGRYEARGDGFAPGGCTLHNCMCAHGPDVETFERASSAQLAPQYLADSLAIMFEARFAYHVTPFALETPELQRNYSDVWSGLRSHFTRQA